MSFNDPFNFKFVVDSVDTTVKTTKLSPQEMYADWRKDESLYEKEKRLKCLKGSKIALNKNKPFLFDVVKSLEAEIQEYTPSLSVEMKLNAERPLPKANRMPKGGGLSKRKIKEIDTVERVELEPNEKDLKLVEKIKRELKGFSFADKIKVPMQTFVWRNGVKVCVRISELDKEELEEFIFEIKDNR